MKLFLLGATGKAGSAILTQALDRGYLVTAFVRTPTKVTARHQNLTVVQGDVLNLDALNAYLPGHDAVISALSPGTLKQSNLQLRFIENVTAAMANCGVKRLLALSVTFLFPNASPIVAIAGKTIFRHIRNGSGDMEDVIQKSGLAWTIIRLPRLTDDNLPGKYHACAGNPPPAKSISRGTLAGFVLTEVEHNKFLRTVVGISV